MRAIFVVLAVTFFTSSSFSKEILLECGENTSDGFNGWYVEPFNVFEEVVFTDETIDFYAEGGGDYTISFTRKISAMKDYSSLELSLKIDAIENSKINCVDVYVSSDGKTWKAISVDQKNLNVIIRNNQKDLQYLKICANVSFNYHGYLRLAYLRLEGEHEWAMEEIESIDEKTENDFFMFCFNKSLTVETRNSEPYEIVFVNLIGQVVYSEMAVESTRIEPDLIEGVYVVSVIQNGAIIQSKKVVF